MSLAKDQLWGVGVQEQKTTCLWSLAIVSLSLPSLGHLVMCDPLREKSLQRERD